VGLGDAYIVESGDSLEDFYPVEEADLEPTADGFLEAENCAHLP